MKKSHLIASALAPLLILPTIAPAQSQQPTGLDALDENRVMTELANRGMETLLKREFEINKTPAGQQNGILTLIAIRRLSDPGLKGAEKQDLLDKINKGIAIALPSIKDPTALMQLAKTLLNVGVDSQVNALEYFGENAKTQAQLRPLVETVLKIYDQAAAEAGKRADDIANKLTPNDTASDTPVMKQYKAADELRTVATYSANMARYDLCLAIDKADPRRKQVADQAIEALSQFDNNDSTVQAAVRNRIAKLRMARGDYTGAKKQFDTVINNSNGEIKPPPDPSQQYEARYFSVVCDILSKKLNDAQKSMDTLDAWQQTNPLDAGAKSDAARKSVRDGVAAAFAMLRYRILIAKSDLANDADSRKKSNDEAIATLMQLLKDQPQSRAVIFQQILSRLPEDAPVATLDPLLLLAVQQQAEQEYVRPEGQKIDEKAMNRGIDAAREIIRRPPGNGLDAATIARSSYVLPYLLERAGRQKEAATAFLDYAQGNQGELKNANDAIDHAGSLIEQLRKQDMQDQETRQLYDRIQPLAIGPPFNRKQAAFGYGLQLEREHQFKKAAEYLALVPADDKRIIEARLYQMLALKQRLGDPNDKIESVERTAMMTQIQSLADQVTRDATAAAVSAKTPEDKKRYVSMIVRTRLIAAHLAAHDQHEPKRALELLNGLEDSAKGMADEQNVLVEALDIRVTAYMSLGQTNDATSTLVQLINLKGATEGVSLVVELLKKLDDEMDQARSAGDVPHVKQLAMNRATLSGFLAAWAEKNTDPATRTKYKVFDATTKRMAAEMTDDPTARKAQLDAALKQYTDLYDANNPDPVVQLGMGVVQYDLGNYKAAVDLLGPLVSGKRIGTPTVTITENGEPKTVENPQHWEAILKLLRAVNEVARQSPSDEASQTALADSKRYLKTLYVQWPTTIGGTKYHDEFEKLRAEIIPDFHPEQLGEPASQPVAGS